MRYLLDTHVLLWAALNDRKLSRHAAELLVDPENIIVVSVASFWEIAIKENVGKLQLGNGLFRAVQQTGYEILPVLLEHVEHVRGLPLHHKDPFDRILVAQAQSESMPLITHDKQLSQYRISIVQV